MLLGILSAAGASPNSGRALASVPVNPGWHDQDGNGVEDDLDAFLRGQQSWSGLRVIAAGRGQKILNSSVDTAKGPSSAMPRDGDWAAGRVRIIGLGPLSQTLGPQLSAADSGTGVCRVVHSSDLFGGFCVLAVDSLGLCDFLTSGPGGSFLLDREGIPALDTSRLLVGADQVAAGGWQLGQDWSGTVAVLDSGCDTAHGDLGDYSDDDLDGPAPAVGDAGDWYAADSIWPLFTGYKVVGWQDVTDDFPLAAGPWDYHHHGTALASVVAGSGAVNEDFRGMAAQGRLVIVKFYDFDQVWHAWAGDFLAAAAWALENRDIYRIRSLLVSVNWEVDAGISAAMTAFLEAGILPVVAMGNFGNSGSGPGYPASSLDVLTVGSVNDAGAVAAYSGRGLPDPIKPDLLAPGGGLLIPSGRITAADNEPNDSYSGRQGTSLAAAHAAGAVYLLGEAMIQNGVSLPADAAGARLIKGLLQTTAAHVSQAESSDGTGMEVLPYGLDPDPIRGWGMLRVDAACEAMFTHLFPGQSQVDNLDEGFSRPVAARRLVLSEGLQYLVEAIPAPGLDISLEVVQVGWLVDSTVAQQILRVDTNGVGTSEFTYFSPESPDWSFLVVKRISGQGTVTLRVMEESPLQAAWSALPGNLSGAPNWGHCADQEGLSLVVPSLVQIDDGARSLNLLDTNGVSRQGWPVFIFPPVSSIGGLTQPLVWNLDGVPGDEIVVASDFGTVYFFSPDGTNSKVPLAFNRPLTAPVGVVTAAAQRQVVVLDRNGQFRSWAWGPLLQVDRPLEFVQPLQPAVGQVSTAEGEEIVVAFADGQIMVLDAQGETLPGWPLDLGSELTLPPVLADLDDDGLHEIYVPFLASPEILRLRVLMGDGQPGPGDDVQLLPPGGGGWLAVSRPAIAGSVLGGDLRLVVAGVGNNGLTGQEASMFLGRAGLRSGGVPFLALLRDFQVDASTSQGYLDLLGAIIPPPIAWKRLGELNSDPAFLASLRWQEIIYGVTSIPGSLTAQFSPLVGGPPMSAREPLGPGGRAGDPVASAGVMVLPLGDGIHCLVEIINDELGIRSLTAGQEVSPIWSTARADGRNSGAAPLSSDVTSAAVQPHAQFYLQVKPNPGADRFVFRLAGSRPCQDSSLDIFDLRGRRVRQLMIPAGGQAQSWDGRNGRGQRVGAGVYLVRVRQGAMSAVTRVMVTR